MTRAIILSATIAALICMYLDRPRPIQTVETKYCLQDIHVAERQVLIMPDGRPVIKDGKLVERWQKLWAKGYAPCSQMDRYEWA